MCHFIVNIFILEGGKWKLGRGKKREKNCKITCTLAHATSLKKKMQRKITKNYQKKNMKRGFLFLEVSVFL